MVISVHIKQLLFSEAVTLNDMNTIYIIIVFTCILYKDTICWNHVFHQKFPNMECGRAGHYHYPLQLQLVFIKVNNSYIATGQSVFVSCTSSQYIKCSQLATKGSTASYLKIIISYSYVLGQLYTLSQLYCTKLFTFQLALFLELLLMKFTE